MNRIIKFRGKDLETGGWIEGSLTTYPKHYPTITHVEDADPVPEKTTCVVIPETVGQYTGLRDRNGKEIYEGDIVQLNYITTIGKHRIGISFEVKWCTQEGCWVGWDGFVANALQQTRKMFVVKGNIHDNPKLLNKE